MKNNTFLFFCLFFLLAYLPTNAQEDNSILEEASYVPPKMELKFSPLSILPLPISSIQFAFEHRLKNPRRAFQHELGILRPFPYHLINQNDVNKMGGFRWRTGYRYYLNEPRPKTNFFISGQYHTQFEQWNLTNWFDRFDGAYRQQFTYNKRVMSHGLLATTGFNLKAKRSRFGFELSASAGAKIRTVFNQNIPDDATGQSNNVIATNNQFAPQESEEATSNILPVVHLSVKLGFVIK